MTETDSTITLLEEVCRALGEGWTMERDEVGCESSWHWQLQGPEYGLAVRYDLFSPKVRFHIHLSVSHELSKHSRYEAWPSINVTEARGAAAIAAEIRRRLLPMASEVYAKLVERQAAAVEFERGQWLILDTVADALGVEHLERDRGFDQSVYRSTYKGSGRCTSAWLTANCGDVEIKLSGVPVATAVAICHLLKGREE